MGNIPHVLALVLIAALLISACQPALTALRPPNLNELKAFSTDRGITPVVDKLMENSSVLLYEDGNSFGYYTLTVREGEGIQATSQVSAAKSDQPILVIGQLTGNQPFMAVVIQEAALLAETKAIEIYIDPQNRLTATTDGKAGVILFSPSPVEDWETVTLYDAQGNILFSQDKSPVQQLRVINSGSVDIKSLAVLFPGKTADSEAIRVEFGDVTAGGTTEYRNVPSGVYRYAAYEYSQNGGVVKQSVMD